MKEREVVTSSFARHICCVVLRDRLALIKWAVMRWSEGSGWKLAEWDCCTGDAEGEDEVCEASLSVLMLRESLHFYGAQLVLALVLCPANLLGIRDAIRERACDSVTQQ